MRNLSTEEAVAVLNFYNSKNPLFPLAWSPGNVRDLRMILNRLRIRMDLQFIADVSESESYAANLANAVLCYFGWDFDFLCRYKYTCRIDEDMFAGCVVGDSIYTELYGSI